MSRRNQPRLKSGKRSPVGAAVIEAIEKRLRQEMRENKCSRSFVIATALAFTFNISEQEDYRIPRKVRKTNVVAFRRNHGRRKAS